jgi:hyaluronate lyase
VTLLREDRTGTWLNIDTGATTHGTDVPYTRRYQKILLDHGANPAGAEYAYAVLPRASADRTRETRWSWRVLANTTAVQAVQLDDEVTGAAWYAAGEVDGVTMSGPAAAMWGRTRDGWTLAVSDPTQLQSVVRVTVDRAVRHVVQADPTITVIARAPRVADSLGATHTLVAL